MRDEQPPIDEWWEYPVTGTGGTDSDCETEHADRDPPVADGGLRMSKFMEVLADERRRYVLYYLRDVEHAELEELTEQVAAWETQTPPEELAEQTRRNVRIDLYHAQLPKLEETGIIEYDRRNGTMHFRHLPDPLEEFLDYCATVESPDALG